MNRINERDLNALVKRINEKAGTPLKYVSDDGQGINVGHYHIGAAYGGYRLEQTCNTGGGIKVVSAGGYTTRRHLHDQMRTLLDSLPEPNPEPLRLHGIAVRFLGPTSTRGSRIKLTSTRFGTSKIVSYDYSHQNSWEQAVAWLRDNGCTPTAYVWGEGKFDDVIAIAEFSGTPFNKG